MLKGIAILKLSEIGMWPDLSGGVFTNVVIVIA